MRKIALVAIGSMAALVLAGCGSSSGSTNSDTRDTAGVTRNFDAMEKTQPVPQADSSQLRQTIIDAENAEIHGIATTTFFYNMGSNTPIMVCPSLGFPVPATDQLTAPEKVQLHEGNYNGGNVTLPQGEPTGVYTGQTSGTYVVCVLPNGQKQVDYWEGDVYTTGGSAHLNGGTIVEDGTTVKSGGK